ncbi:MAG TPA: sugar ABC transporter ATP-binding protein [Solirubrobacterales bacterium]|jgi:ribose transport system ATP-binding protein|nr:sugar ABC transporter ATP-binding protein [Solirubrobacterales bacterium]
MKQLRMEKVSKHFGAVAALQDATFVGSGGEVHALLGENGAGKSTFIKILAGALAPDSGDVTLDGKALEVSKPQDAAEAGIAVVYQELSLIPDLTVAQSLWFGREELTPIRTVSKRKLVRRTEELFASLDIAGISPKAQVGDLTVGERQLVEIAKALSVKPAVLILDEASSALAPRETAWLLEVSRSAAAGGALVIYISHRLGEVRQVADNITFLRNGSTVGTHPVGELTDEEIVNLMLGRRAGNLYPERPPTESAEPVLEARELSFGSRLSGVDISLRPSEIVGVGGLQGQGQLELFLSLAGAVRPRGTIELGGKKVSFRTPRDALRAGVGVAFVPEDRKSQGLLLEKSVRENIVLPVLGALSRMGIVNRAAEREAVESVIDDFGVVLHDPGQPAQSLSGGNQQKIVLGKMLLTSARVILLYDVTRGVDVGAKAEIFTLMARLAGEGYALLFFSTDNEELVNLCDRVIVMSDGRQCAMLTSETLTDEGILHASLAQDSHLAPGAAS